MKRLGVVVGILGIFAFLSLGLDSGLRSDRAAAGESAPKIRLAVIVVFDQLRGDYLEKWKDLFEEGGFKRLQQEGAWFTDCHYPYSDTWTAAGHASIVTGASPYKHGIIANEWYDRASGDLVGAVTSDRYEIVPPVPREETNGDTVTRLLGCSPLRRCEESIGDVLYRVSQQKAKIASFSIKETAAALLAALRAQLVYWFSVYHGGFVTSSYYQEAPQQWVREFNKKKLPDAWFNKAWTRQRPDLDYVKFSGPDDIAFEGIGIKQGRTFPHPMTGGREKIGKEFYEAVTVSPYGNDLLLEFAKNAIESEKLGQNGVTDLLCLSFSSTDLVGHCWGPDSQEVLDITLHADRTLKSLLDFLDEKIGKGRYLLTLTADHGVCPIPELRKSQGKDAGRVDAEALTKAASAFLQDQIAKGERKLPWIEKFVGSWFYLNRTLLRSTGLPQADVEKALAAWLVKQNGIQAVFTRSELQTKNPLKDPLAEQVRKSFFAEASGDVKVVLKPYYLFGDPQGPKKTAAYVTTHGSPHPYDTHVPLLVMGPGVRPGVRGERVTPQAVAGILSRGLNVPMPTAAEAPAPKGLFEE